MNKSSRELNRCIRDWFDDYPVKENAEDKL